MLLYVRAERRFFFLVTSVRGRRRTHLASSCYGSRTDNAIKNHWYSSMRRTMRRMAKQQNKSLGQSGRAVLSAKASKQHQLQQQQLLQQHRHQQQQQQQQENADLSRGFYSDPDSPGSDMCHVMNGLSPKQSNVYKDCYSVMLKNADGHHDDDGSFTRALAGVHHGRGVNSGPKGSALVASGSSSSAAAKKGSSSSKRKRKDLRICTTTGEVSSGSGGGMFLPDTPRRALHTQLLLQLLGNNGSDDTLYLTGGAKRKKRSGTPVSGKNATLMQSMAMQPSSKGTEYSGDQSAMDEQAFNDMDGSFHSFEHLDIDFNEVRLLG